MGLRSLRDRKNRQVPGGVGLETVYIDTLHYKLFLSEKG